MADIKINDTTLTFPKIWYCNYETGDNTTGDGSESNPYQTIMKCHSVSSSGDAIKLQPVSNPEIYRYQASGSYPKSISIIGAEDKAIVGIDNGGSYIAQGEHTVKFYQCYIRTKDFYNDSFYNNVTTECYACVIDLAYAIWKKSADAYTNARFYNCLFVGANGENVYRYGLRSSAELYDSVIVAERNTHTSKVGELGPVHLIRSWINDQYYTDLNQQYIPVPDLKNDYLFNADFSLTAGFSSGNADVGVYSGDFRWDGLVDELSVKRFLLRNAASAAFKYDTGSFVQVNSSEPTEADFTTHGMKSIPKIPVSELAAWEPSGSFTLEFYNSLATDTSVKSLQITSVPKARIALPKGTFDVSDILSLDGISIAQDLAATGSSRFAVSVDGTDWKVWNGSSWTGLNALSVDQVSADYLMSNGMTGAQLAALSWTEFQQLYTGSPTTIAVAYAVEAKAIDDKAEIDYVRLKIAHSGKKWVRDHGQIELEIAGTHFTATPAINCTYKVNYQDSAA